LNFGVSWMKKGYDIADMDHELISQALCEMVLIELNKNPKVR